MLYPRQIAVLFMVSLIGTMVFGITPGSYGTATPAKEAPIPVEDSMSVAEGRLAEFSANGRDDDE